MADRHDAATSAPVVRGSEQGRSVSASVCLSLTDGNSAPKDKATSRYPSQAFRAHRPCPYISSVQETSRCCKEDEERRPMMMVA